MTLGLVLAALAGALAPGASAATWDPLQTIQPLGAPGMSSFEFRPPGMIERQDARGDVVVAWSMEVAGLPATDVDHVELAYKPAGRPWAPVERIGTAGTGLGDVEMDASGDVTISYGTAPPGVDSGSALYVVTRAADGTYGPVQTLQASADSFSRAGLIALGVDDAGSVLVIYSAVDGQPLSDYRPAGGVWQAPVPLQTVPYNGGVGIEGLVMRPDGEAFLLQASLAPDLHLQPALAERRFSPVGGWGAAVPVTAPVGAGLGPTTLVLPTGELVTFRITTALTTDSYNRTVEAASLAPGATTWGAFAPIATAPEGVDVTTLQYRADDAGEIVLSFSEDRGNAVPHGYAMAAIRSATGSWGPLQQLGTALGDAAPPSLAVAGDGRAVIETEVASSDPDHTSAIALFEREPGGTTWTPMAAPFVDQPGAQLFGGPGHELVGVTRTQGLLPGQQLTSETLAASLLTTATSGNGATPVTAAASSTPATAAVTGAKSPSKAGLTTSKAAAARPAIALVGKGACRSARTPCRTARAVRLSLNLPEGATRVRVTIQRMRGGRWRGVRVLSLRPVKGKARVSLPLGRLRLSTAPVHDSRAHVWVAYLLVR